MASQKNPLDKLRSAATGAITHAKGGAAVGRMVAGQIGRAAVGKAAETAGQVRSRRRRTATPAAPAAPVKPAGPPQALATDPPAAAKQGTAKKPAKRASKKTAKKAAKKTAATPADVAEVVAKKAPAASTKKAPTKKAPATKSPASSPGDRLPRKASGPAGGADAG